MSRASKTVRPETGKAAAGGENAVQSFAPALGRHPRILILGSMPGRISLLRGQYYAHPQNAFWSIMTELLGGDPHWDYRRRLAMLKRGGVALWDVFARCERQGSLDSAIARHTEVANEIPALLRRRGSIRLVACNGAKAHQGFVRHILPALQSSEVAGGVNDGENSAGKDEQGPALVRLPSSSPAHARISRAQKLELWREALSPWLDTV